ncbi:3',5'-cyclic-nucleotide phosphodiesterase [Klebsiella pneumoniae subsp. pneumoniae]|uniref:3',5'-cyclic-nucleotide phosphodiesterase n=1 Tax=Klebsiella pneumoniae subsp. pneumoniae TaxID=72407 RepID=A0A378AND1_KLEPN|nr:3',5'-cyclic-nucleotide phosphodiesterase [Klebsiella pneumoniae subsp. pneumoniae]
MLLAHISDTHFRSRGEKLYGFIDVNAANADVVSQLNALRERPDAVVVSGDIVNCGRPEEYQVARQILGSLNYPLYLIPGNHDDKAHFLEHLHPLCPQLGNDPQICAMRWMTSPPACCLSTPVMPARQKAG